MEHCEAVAGEHRQERRGIHEAVQEAIRLSQRPERSVMDDHQHRATVELRPSDQSGERVPLLLAHDAVRQAWKVRNARRLEPDDRVPLAQEPHEREPRLDRDVGDIGDKQIPEALLEAASAVRPRRVPVVVAGNHRAAARLVRPLTHRSPRFLELHRQGVGRDVTREDCVVDLERVGLVEDARDRLRSSGEGTRPAAEGQLAECDPPPPAQAQEGVPRVVGSDVDVGEVKESHRAPGS